MTSHFRQSSRQGRLTTALGKNALVLLRMDGKEALSDDFEWRVEALSDQSGVDIHNLLGTRATVEIDHANGTRAFDGIVCEAEAKGAFENGFRYDLVLRSWLHTAELRRNMRIFHSKTVVEIVMEVLNAYAGHGRPHLDVQLDDSYPVLEYTVQYGESAADFVSRELERHGISWSWAHVAGNHTMILTVTAFSLPEVPGVQRPYYSVDGFHQHEEEHFDLWSAAERITTGAVRLTDYNFKIPTASQEVTQSGTATHAAGDIESYDWPGDYLNQTEGRGVVVTRQEAESGQAPRHRAEGDVVSLGAGWRVTLAGDAVAGATGQGFVCLTAEHRFRAQAYGTGEAGGDEAPYRGTYALMPADTPYRPDRRTKAPLVHGPETAVVVGQGEIDCDEHGRILCRFHWDLEAAHTMRVRVSQNWASKGWGGMVLPRVGMEVIVEHLRGDPDTPIVTGCVYNGKNIPPYELPKHKTRSTFRTDTHQGDGFNELRFEDENGEEEIYLHAQKDRNTKVEHNQTERVNTNKGESVGKNKGVEIGQNLTEVVDGNMDLRVGPANKGTFTPAGANAEPEGIKFVATTMTEPGGVGDLKISVENSKTQVVGRDHFETVSKDKTTEVGADYTATVGKRIEMRAGDEIELICGKSRIKLLANGTIEINGQKIMGLGDKLVSLQADKIKLN